MANEKILNTRIQLKYDSLANWNASTFKLKAGEVAIATLGETKDESTHASGQHPVLFKVGTGNHTFAELPFVSALAADVHGWAKKSESEFTTWVKSLIEITDIDAYSKKEVDDKLSANSTADQKYAKDYADALIAGLDATASQNAGTDGLALSITEVDGKITAISGSIAANTYDAYGSAAAAQAAAATDATNKANAAQAAAESHADGLNTTMAARVKELEDHKEDYKAYAEAEADAAEAAAKQDAANKLATARTEITAEISKAISDSATTEGGVIAGVKADVVEAAEAAAAAQETANEGVTKAEAAQIAADAAQKTIDDFLTGENVTEAVDTLKEIQEELKSLGEAVDLAESFAKKADKVTGATSGNFAGLDANGNLTDSGKKAADFATAEQGAKADNALPTATFNSTIANYYTKTEADAEFMNGGEVDTKIAAALNGDNAIKVDSAKNADVAAKASGLDESGVAAVKAVKVDNALHADAALKVDNKLTITANGAATEYDGSAAKSVDLDAIYLKSADFVDTKYTADEESLTLSESNEFSIKDKGVTTAKIADHAIGAHQTKACQDYSGEDAEVWVFYCGTSGILV